MRRREGAKNNKDRAPTPLQETRTGISRSRNPIIEKIGVFLLKYRGTGTGLRRAKQLCPCIQFDNNLFRNAFIVTISFQTETAS